MSKYQQILPTGQSRALLAAGLAALGAAALGSAVYAFQSASTSQELMGIPTDAVIKTTLAVVADFGVAFGAAVSLWLWRQDRQWSKRQAYVAIAATAWAFVMGVSNLSGYSAWTREQHGADAARHSPLYEVAVAHAEAARAHADMPASYFISSREQDLIEAATVPATAERTGGDVFKAIGLHALILMFGFAFRLPAKRSYRRRRKTAAKKTTRSTRKPAKRPVRNLSRSRVKVAVNNDRQQSLL